VVLLTFYAEQSSGDIATSLGLSSENVRVIRHRSVARLRDCLGLGTVRPEAGVGRRTPAPSTSASARPA